MNINELAISPFGSESIGSNATHFYHYDANVSVLMNSEFEQLSIYNEMRRRNKTVEAYRHVLGVLGTLLSVFGILGE